MIPISNTDKGGMSRERKEKLIAEALADLSADVLELLYRIIFHAESGLE